MKYYRIKNTKWPWHEIPEGIKDLCSEIKPFGNGYEFNASVTSENEVDFLYLVARCKVDVIRVENSKKGDKK